MVYPFVLFVLPLIKGTLAAVEYPPLPKDLTTPYQQRLAINGPNAVSVGWNTYGTLSQSCVKYGISADNLSTQACSTSSSTYDSSRTYSHTVVLTELKPATIYYYKIVSTNSSVVDFLSPRSPGDQTPFNFDVVIDLGVYGRDGFTVSDSTKRDIAVDPELNHTTISRLATTENDYEFIIHPGDFAYSDDWFLRPHNILHGKDAYQSILEQFYNQLAPISSRFPYMASPGNHEAACGEVPFITGLCPDGQRNFTDFMHRFADMMPTAFPSNSADKEAQMQAEKARSLAKPPFWYSFEYGMVHIAMIDTETDFPEAPDGQHGSAGLNGGPFGSPNQQLDFLEADLASVNRTLTPWVIVAGHRPWYTTGSGPCKPCREAFEHIFYRYGVDLGIFGHVHNSQRFLPVVNDTADPKGMKDPKSPMYIIAGGAGNIEGLSRVGSKPSFTEFAYDDDFSYATIKILDRNNLQVDFIRSSTGDVLDSSTLYKSHDTSFVVQ
ncbi:purple acid phosphatase family protein [Aspergillus tanneri]|nr:uncharacterized protein ATNIH1004_000190 [Aspergillus tanneri]KAA8651309.1 hypothetical protein ATNIH1004_000190 [Aspergillus tanneri]